MGVLEDDEEAAVLHVIHTYAQHTRLQSSKNNDSKEGVHHGVNGFVDAFTSQARTSVTVSAVHPSSCRASEAMLQAVHLV